MISSVDGIIRYYIQYNTSIQYYNKELEYINTVRTALNPKLSPNYIQ